MSLTINLKPHERLIVNGVVLQNTAFAVKLLVHNEAALLREKDIITEEGANTPARRVYYAIQCRYLFPDKASLYLPLIYRFLEEFAEAAPSASRLVEEIRSQIDGGLLYQALKSAKRLIAREREILDGPNTTGV